MFLIQTRFFSMNISIHIIILSARFAHTFSLIKDVPLFKNVYVVQYIFEYGVISHQMYRREKST